MSCTTHATPLGQIEREFALLASGDRPLTVDGFDIGSGLPEGPVPLGQLREIMLDRSTARDTKQSVWAVLVANAQSKGPEWTVAAAGMMVPGLRRIVSRVARTLRSPQDVQSEVIVGFLECLRSLDPNGRALASTLWWAAYKRAVTAVRSEIDSHSASLADNEARANGCLRPPPGHPDLVLAQAIRDNVLEADDAELIASTRIEKESLHDQAKRRGLTYQACRSRRWRAESKLTKYLGHGCLVGLHPDLPALAAA